MMVSPKWASLPGMDGRQCAGSCGLEGMAAAQRGRGPPRRGAAVAHQLALKLRPSRGT
jgi:hypothetical protein